MPPARLTFFLAVVFPALFASPVAALSDMPHAFMADVYACSKCHEKVPEIGKDDAGTVVLKKDIVTLCEECHQSMINSDKHPVDIRPDRPVPPKLPLDNYFSITCVTCHDPHGKPFADAPYVPYTWLDRLKRLARGEKRHRTYFLRVSNVRGDLCLSCHTTQMLTSEGERLIPPGESLYVGSAKCRECHKDIHTEWGKTVHARYVGDPVRAPGIVRAKFEGDKPFPPSSLLFTLGEHWTQRYVVKGPSEPLVRPEIWSIQSNEWINSGTYSRSWYRYCAGCHTTGFNPFKGTYVEVGIGCEACHGPGKAHCESTDQFDIVNPAKLTENRRNMICEACHTSGHDRSGLYRFPVGYQPGADLTKFFTGLIPKPGQEADTYTGDGSYDDRHRQFLYWVSRYNITQGILCDVCKNFRQAIPGGSGELFLSPSEFCATCHSEQWKDYRGHAKHTPEQAGCMACHMPQLSRDRQGYSIHDHKFQFGKPLYAEELTPEKSCRRCHDTTARVSRK